MEKNDSEPILVVQIIGQLIRGGVEAVINNYYRALDHSKIDFVFFVEEGSPCLPLDDILKIGGKFYYIPSPKHPIKHIKKVYRLLLENKYDVVHVNLNTLSIFSLFASKCAKIPVRISHSHSTTSKGEPIRNMAKYFLRIFSHLFCTEMFACSEQAAIFQFGKKAYLQNKVFIMKNGIDTDRFKFSYNARNRIRKELDIKADTIVVGNVGRCVTQKNQKFLLNVFADFKEKNPNSVLLILGDGPLFNDLKEQSQELCIEDSVLLLGTKDSMSDYYSAMDLFCLPSLYEGLPVSILEAQCNGLPVLMADTISDEVCFDFSEQLSLQADIAVWSKHINECLKIGRYDGITMIKKNGFDIKMDVDDYMNKIESMIDN